MQTVQQDSDSRPLAQEEIGQKVDAIIAKYVPTQADSKLIKKQIIDAISWDGDKQKALFLLEKFNKDLFQVLPSKLKDDEDVLLSMLEKKPEMFLTLSFAHRANPKLQEAAFTALLNKKAHIYDLITVIDRSEEKQRKKFQKLIRNALDDGSYSFKDDLSKLYYEIYQNEKKLYKTLIEKKIFTQLFWWFALSKDFIASIVHLFQESSTELWEIQETELMKTLLSFLNIKPSDMSDISKSFFWELIKGITFPKTKTSGEDENNSSEDETDSKDSKTAEDEDTDSWLSEYESIGPYTRSSYWARSNVWSPEGDSILIKTEILENMSEKCLENYMSFSKLMWELWLGFLLEKHTQTIQTATQVNFYDWEWMSQARILKFLNSIGRNIWIPESTYEDSQGNKKTSCFESLWAARMHFRKVSSSWEIGGFYIDPSKRWDKSVVEHYMKFIDLLVEPFWELSISSWK